MPIELQKDVFSVDRVIGQEASQAIIEGDILVPDTKPDISRIISVDGTMEINKKEVAENCINVEGLIRFKILYVSDRGDEPLYSIDSSTGFKHSIPIEGLTPKMRGEVQGELEHVGYSLNNERKIGIKAVIDLKGTGIETVQQQLTRDILGVEDIQILRENLRYATVAGEAVAETLVKDTFEVESHEAPIKEILKWDAVAVEKETKVTDNKVIASGNLVVELLYLADDEDSTLMMMKKEVPFTQFIEMNHVDADMRYKLKMTVERMNTEVRENIQGERKIVEVEAVAKSAVKVLDTVTREMVVDAYAPSKPLKVHKSPVNWKEHVGMNRSHALIREVLDLPATHPEIDTLFSVQVKPILTDYHLVEDKAVIEGVLEATVLYRAIDAVQPLYSFMQEVPFRHYVDILGLKEDMEANIDLHLEDVDTHMINSVQVDLKVNLGATCEAYAHKSMEVVQEVEEMEMEATQGRRPSLTVYFMQPGDTLWKVAKRYQTTVKHILETNHLTTPEEVRPGDFLLIEKVHQFKF